MARRGRGGLASNNATTRGGRRSQVHIVNNTPPQSIPEPEPEERNFVSAQKISPHLSCPVCTEVFIRPMRCPCGHSFCEQCIMPWLQKGNQNCPLDRKIVRPQELHHDFILESIIGDHKVSCPWRNLGCRFVDALHLLKGHKNNCPFNPDHLPPPLRQRQLDLLKRPMSYPVMAVDSFIAKEEQVTGENEDQAVADSSLAQHRSDESDGEDFLAPPGPSLLIRVYNDIDSSAREDLVTILSAGGPPPAKRPAL